MMTMNIQTDHESRTCAKRVDSNFALVSSSLLSRLLLYRYESLKVSSREAHKVGEPEVKIAEETGNRN